MEKWITTTFLCLSPCYSLLLGLNSSQDIYSAHNFNQLLDLLLEEKHLRGQLENHVGSLEMQISNLQLELASQKKDTDQAILHQRNETDTKMKLFNHTLEKEKSNRRQLEREYTKLSLDYQHLTNQYNDLSAMNTNMSLAYDLLLNRYSLLEGKLTNLAQETGQMNQSLLLSVTTNHAEILELRQKQSYQVGFTACTPKNGTSPGTIGFTKVISNIGNQFNANTGTFTCVYPGIYYFYMSVYQSKSSHIASCWFRKNGSDLLRIVSDNNPSSSGTAPDGYFQAGNAIVTHLSKGDILSLGHCYPLNITGSMDQLTSFSGVLIKSD